VTPPGELLRRYASRGLLIDTNILLVYVAGLADRALVEKLRRNKRGYTAAEFDLLARLVAQFHLVVTTPHVLRDDFALYGRLTAEGLDAINFTHIRFWAGQ